MVPDVQLFSWSLCQTSNCSRSRTLLEVCLFVITVSEVCLFTITVLRCACSWSQCRGVLVHGHEASTVPVRDHSARCKSMPVDARGAQRVSFFLIILSDAYLFMIMSCKYVPVRDHGVRRRPVHDNATRRWPQYLIVRNQKFLTERSFCGILFFP